MSNLKHKAIVSDTWLELADELNKFSETNVEVKYTQTHIENKTFYALVYYKDKEGSKEDLEKEEKQNTCEDCGKKLTDKVAEFSLKKYKKHPCFKCQKLKR